MCVFLVLGDTLQGRDQVCLLRLPQAWQSPVDGPWNPDQDPKVLIIQERERVTLAAPSQVWICTASSRSWAPVFCDRGSSLSQPSSHLLRQRPTTELGARVLHCRLETELLAPKLSTRETTAIAAKRGASDRHAQALCCLNQAPATALGHSV